MWCFRGKGEARNGMNDQWKQRAANYLNCSQLVLPFVYLGIPIGANPRRARVWEPIIQKCERRLARWKQRFISFGGRVTLIQSVLTSIPIYYFSFFRVPKSVINRLIKLQRSFLWGGGQDSKKIAWIAWEKTPLDRKSTRLNSSHYSRSRMPSSA